ncbi:glutamine synthetase family protein [Hyphococcus sp.]|uniref:glutamine synthetase family protein n=1 Tax=Hyphococcus sp. TaxID=2038636 RepID=UPI00208CC8D2|nr:MAG: glutamine synthetase [Marinicaulis sp.]
MELDELKEWMRERRIGDVSCLTPDMGGAARGKNMTPGLFLSSVENKSLRIPEATYTISVHGDIVFNDHVKGTEHDLVLSPDLSTIHLAPWNTDATAAVICDAYTDQGAPFNLAPRQVLRNVIDLYRKKGWTPIVGPEVEFYLIARFTDVVLEPRAPDGASGLREFGQHVYSLDAIDEFDKLFEELYQFCDAQNVDLETLIHEDGPCQFEVNIRHGDAMKVADQLFLFKRLARQVAKRHGMFVTFMAKPYADESGSSIHLHQSVVDAKTSKNIFATPDGEDTDLFRHFIGGLQAHLPAAMPLLAPYTNSYNRFEAFMSAPTNTHWGRENRTVGLRVPASGPDARRVENRISGADINPYLAISASLVCGYIGMAEKIEPRAEYVGEGYEDRERPLPSTLTESVETFSNSAALKKYLGEGFVETYAALKRAEYEHRSSVLSPWDVRFLMVNV